MMPHGTSETDCEHDEEHEEHEEHHEPVKPWVYNQSFAIPEGQTHYVARHDIAIPQNIDEGDYHFMIRLTDAAGHQQIKAVAIKIVK